MSDDPFVLVITPTARRELTESLPGAVAFAAYAFIAGPLLINALRVGKRLQALLADATVPDAARTGSSTASLTINTSSRSLLLYAEPTRKRT